MARSYSNRKMQRENTVKVFQKIFTCLEIPKVIVSDNGLQFISKEINRFVVNNKIKHVQIAPYYPASNKLAKRFVQYFKRAIVKSKVDNIDKILDQF